MSARHCLVLLFADCLWAAPAGAQVTHHPDPDAPLEARWRWAHGSDDARDAWVGYSIDRLMDEGSYIGSWSSDERARPSLQELIYGTRPEPIRVRGGRGGATGRKVLKPVALLFRMRGGEVVDVRVSNLSLHADLGGRPLWWLGGADHAESLALLRERYDAAEDTDLKESLVMNVSLHEAGGVLPFLEAVLTGSEGDEVRGAAAFWIGQREDDRALALLRTAARGDRSGEVRERAVFGISQISTAEATEALIELARSTGADPDVREQAIFWLGQKASERATQALEDVAFDAAETDVQKQAVFALSQQAEGVPLLIKIARTHANPKVREQAIFWLGQSDDPRAFDVIVELARGR